jgi:hypothetical protein
MVVSFSERPTLSKRALLVSAVAGNLIIIGLCLAVFGFDHEGAGSATRNTARFASIFFLAGFAAPGLVNRLAWFPQPAALIHGFVAAQMVHFGSVAMLHTVFAQEQLHLSLPVVVLVVGGFSLVALAGFAAGPHARFARLNGIAQVVTLYLIFLILAADYAQHPVRPLRWMAIPVLASLLLRHLPRPRDPQLKPETAL